ncbi:MAG TPA: neutral zinc metallopeptidase [Pirellulaceae bacterium]|nr:neutral zinc metallopeptidase [Pirellulaceae bacterium]
MRWQGNRQSENVEDRRGARRPLMMGGGIGGIILLLLVLFLGGPQAVMQLLQQQGGGPVAGPQVDEDPQATAFVRTVLADTEDVWDEQFQAVGRAYQKPKLVLFSDEVDSACGFASAAVGPFYCPADRKVYLDTSFFRELEQRFEAPGEFAQAYVIAHEIGHHVQNQLGWSDRVQNAQQRVGKVEANKLSVRLELQADYLAGVWAHHAQRSRNILERGDIQAALDAATAIGDDKLQMESRGRVVPDSFTHGTSAQRARWFKRGLQTGDLAGAELLFQVDDSEL